ncbi:hypothetical protein QE152_g19158 [Popillia japonica]|uniref:Uncharacterized protein n=1 Tax=Popillia japonica TaxID=7064 RepID=A0AAW1KY66_POPJA
MAVNYLASCPKLLGRENYDEWCFAVENVFVLEGLTKCIDGTEEDSVLIVVKDVICLFSYESVSVGEDPEDEEAREDREDNPIESGLKNDTSNLEDDCRRADREDNLLESGSEYDSFNQTDTTDEEYNWNLGQSMTVLIKLIQQMKNILAEYKQDSFNQTDTTDEEYTCRIQTTQTAENRRSEREPKPKEFKDYVTYVCVGNSNVADPLTFEERGRSTYLRRSFLFKT